MSVETLEVLRAQRDAARREVKVWRWLHWDQPTAPWACSCGAVIGHALSDCVDCGALRPAKGVALAAGFETVP
jgi:hypothetical protein